MSCNRALSSFPFVYVIVLYRIAQGEGLLCAGPVPHMGPGNTANEKRALLFGASFHMSASMKSAYDSKASQAI